MSRIETYFLLLVVLNLCVTAAYVLWNEQHWREEPGKRTGGRIRAAVMLLAPVIEYGLVGSEMCIRDSSRGIFYSDSRRIWKMLFSVRSVSEHTLWRMRSRSGMWCRSRRHWRFPTGTVCAH